MKTYRAEKSGNIDDLVLHDETEPRPRAGQVLVNVRATSLNYHDLAMIQGTYGMALHPGLIPLSDSAGEVVVAGDGFRRFKAGDRVISNCFPRWLAAP
jgi:NADPH:quinone reductase-like Zn-dependent oxidoreductase